jgi:TonB-dependent starch-binding outer membrane protein SusC
MNYKHLFSLSLLAALLLFVQATSAQSLVQAKVTEAESNEKLPGVNVQVKGTTNGTITDGGGDYSLTKSPESQLIFSFIGYHPQALALGNQSIINDEMKIITTNIETVDVIGYGTAKKKDLKDAVSIVDAKEMTLTQSNLNI